MYQRRSVCADLPALGKRSLNIYSLRLASIQQRTGSLLATVGFDTAENGPSKTAHLDKGSEIAEVKEETQPAQLPDDTAVRLGSRSWLDLEEMFIVNMMMTFLTFVLAVRGIRPPHRIFGPPPEPEVEVPDLEAQNQEQQQ